MKTSLENVSPTRVRLTVEVPPEILESAMAAAYKKIASQVSIPGFRPGKVPTRVIEQRFGRGAVLSEALNDAVPAAYERALAEHGVDALGQPDLRIDQDLSEVADGEPIEFVAEVDVRPQIDLPEYKGLDVEVASVAVSDDDVAEQLDELRGRFAKVTPVERPVADGDIVVVDVEGTIDGERAEEFSGAGMSFEVGSGNMIEGFDDAVRGASEGDTVEFAHIPTEGDLAGADVVLTVKVKGVRERELPAADDDFAIIASEFDSIDELRDDLRERLARVRLVEQGLEARDKLAKRLLDTVEIPVPKGVLAQMLDQHFNDGHGDDDHRAEFEEQTRDTLRSQFLLDAIADAEQVEVSQADISQWIMQQSPRYGMSPDQFVQALVQADQLGNAVGDVRRAKALSIVLENANITDDTGQAVDLAALDDSADDEIDAIEEGLEADEAGLEADEAELEADEAEVAAEDEAAAAAEGDSK